MLVSTKGRYALRVMLELASHDREKFIPLKDIAKNQDISEKYLESIIKVLVKGEMVIGLRGKGGGYKLSRTPETYTVGSILKLSEGPLAPVACLNGNPADCARYNECLTLPMWQGLNEVIDNYLEGITLEDLLKQSRDNTAGDYVI